MTAAETPFVVDTKSGKYILLSRHDHISNHLIEMGEWEAHMAAIIHALLGVNPGDVVDVGANMGAVAIPVALQHPQSQVYCFEAQRVVYQQLCGNAVLNGAFNVFPFHMAIGAPEDNNTLMDVPVPDYAREVNIGAISVDKRVNDFEEKTYERHEKVAMASLDSLGLTNIAVVKIDVEGYEFKVMQGMVNMVMQNNFPSIVFEVWRDEKYPWMKDERELMTSLLEALGYSVTLFEKYSLAIAQHKSRTNLDIQATKVTPAKRVTVSAG